MKVRSWIHSIQKFVYFEDGIYSKVSPKGIPIFDWDNAQQSTELYDTNGIEIYTGDIIQIDKSIVEVIFDKGGFLVKGINIHYINDLSYDLDNYKTKIIGNVYQNSELKENK